MKNWHPDIDLDRLFAALGEEIIDTPDEDIRALCGQVGTPLSGLARDMRKRIGAIVPRSDPELDRPQANGLCRCDARARSH